jgi:hypothetical protein
MEFPPEFWALCSALWVTYQPTILIWFGVMFGMVVVLASAIMLYYIIRPLVSG